MRIEVLDTSEKRTRGLQWRRSVEPDVLWLFPGIPGGTWFHSMNVPEPFDLAFLARDGTVLLVATVTPQAEMVQAPLGTDRAAEAKAGWLRFWGFIPGRRVNF